MSKTVSSIVLGLIIFSLAIGIFYFPWQLKDRAEAGMDETSSQTETGLDSILPSQTELAIDFSDYDVSDSMSGLYADLASVGCDTIITVNDWVSDLSVSSYQDALKLASTAEFVAVYENSQSFGVLIPLEGIIYMWTTQIDIQVIFEKVEIQSGVCTWSSENDYWEISLRIKNTGSATSTLIGVFINEVEVNRYNATNPGEGEACTDMPSQYVISSGQSVTVRLYVDGPGGGDGWMTVSSGTTVNIKLHSRGGMDYIKLIELV